MLQRFSALLWLEELHAEMEMREFTIKGALLRKGSEYLHLEIPGLLEGRPYVNIGEGLCHVSLSLCYIIKWLHGISADSASPQVTRYCWRRSRVTARSPSIRATWSGWVLTPGSAAYVCNKAWRLFELRAAVSRHRSTTRTWVCEWTQNFTTGTSESRSTWSSSTTGLKSSSLFTIKSF